MKVFCLLLLLFTLTTCNNTPSKTYQLIGYDAFADQVSKETARKIEKETGLRLMGTGGGSESQRLRKLNLSLQCSKEITLEEGRKLITYCVSEFLTNINKNEEIKPHLIHFPFTPPDVEIHIFIRQPDNKDVPLGSLAAVSEVRGQVSYDIREPFPVVLKQIHEETFEEALKLVLK